MLSLVAILVVKDKLFSYYIMFPRTFPTTANAYPSTSLGKSNNYKTLFDTTNLDWNKKYNNCSNTLCYTYSKNYIYKPHSAAGMVGTTAASYLARRKKI